MNLDKYMDELCKEMEIPNNLKTQVSGVYSIPLDKDYNVVVTYAPPGFILTCTLGDKPAADEDFLLDAMVANVYGQTTFGSVLGLDDTGKKIILSRMVDWNPNVQEFIQIIEDFINAADFWREESSVYH